MNDLFMTWQHAARGCARPGAGNMPRMIVDVRTPPPRAAIVALADSVPDLLGDLRSDHAGETGAVAIYRGILAITANPALRVFARRHLRTEQEHLALLEAMLAPRQRSLLLPLWRVAGWLTGALPALFGARAVFATIDAVETFVDRHYSEQIGKLSDIGPGAALRRVLLQCQADEVHHRDEAREELTAPPGRALRGWTRLVGAGSAAAVRAARRL